MNELWRQKRPRSDQIGSSGADGGEKRSNSRGAPATLQVRVKEEPGVQAEEEKGRSWVGKTFQKHFPGYGHFQGRIVKYLDEDDLYCVEYDDGDAEELEEYEVRGLLVRIKQEIPQQRDKLTAPDTPSTKRRIQNQSGAKPKGKTAVDRNAKSSAASGKKEQVKERKPGEAQPGWKEMGYSDLDRLVCGPGKTHTTRILGSMGIHRALRCRAMFVGPWTPVNHPCCSRYLETGSQRQFCVPAHCERRGKVRSFRRA